MIKNKLSALVQNQFPDFYKEDGQNFLAFITAYYEYLEQNGKLTERIQNLEDYRDINTTIDEYIEYFQKTLLPSVPNEVAADKKLLAKYVKYFNEARGSLASYKLLFRTIYDEDVEINYPADQMLKVSDGDWRLDRYLVTEFNPKNYDLIGKTIEGTESGAQCLVEDVVGRVVRNREVQQLMVSNLAGTFNHKEPVKAINNNGITHTPIVEAGISSVEIINQGGDYKVGDVVDILSDQVGDLAKVVVTDTIDLNGSITFSIVEGGSGYTDDSGGPDQGETQINITGGDGDTPASFTLSTSDIGDTFAISLNTNLLSSNNIFGAVAPLVVDPYGTSVSSRRMNTFANTPLSSPQFGFPEQNEITTDGKPFLTNSNAIIHVANTRDYSVGDSVFGSATGANGTITEIVSATNGAAKIRIDGYKNFTTSIVNILSYSEQLESPHSSNFWVRENLSNVVANAATAPDGTLTAENVIEDSTAGDDHFVRVTNSVHANDGTKYNTSVYAKARTGGSKRYLGFGGLGKGNNYPLFDLENGTIINTGSQWESGAHTKMEHVGNGWYRCSAATAPSSTAGLRFSLQPTTSIGSSHSDYNGDGASGVLLWGAQMTVGTALQPYQRTTAGETVGSGEFLRIGTANSGVITAFHANTVGQQLLELGVFSNTHTISVGDELVSTTSSSYSGDPIFAVVKKIVSTAANQYNASGADTRDLVKVKVCANTTSNVSSQFDAGMIPQFDNNMEVRKVGSATVVAKVANDSANTSIENVYSKLSDSLVFKTTQFGTIQELSNKVGGSGFSIAPTVTLTEPNISSLGIGEQYITLESTDINFGTGDSNITTLDTNDGLVQTSTGASGDIKAGAAPNLDPVTTVVDGKYRTTVRVLQPFLQRAPGNRQFANNATVAIKIFGSSVIPGEIDTRNATATGSATIIKIEDKGVLGRNAVIRADVGANGAATGFNVIDSGFSHIQNETVRVSDSGRSNATQAKLKLSLKGVANSEGYYGTARSHVSSKRGYIQDSDFYQEYSYQVAAPLALQRYKEVALKLVHPAGQKLFGKFASHSNVALDVTTTANNKMQVEANGTVALSNSNLNLVGTGTEFTKHFSNGDIITIKTHTNPNRYIKIPLNTVTSDTLATTKVQWSATGVTGATIYHTDKGSIS